MSKQYDYDRSYHDQVSDSFNMFYAENIFAKDRKECVSIFQQIRAYQSPYCIVHLRCRCMAWIVEITLIRVSSMFQYDSVVSFDFFL